MQANTNRQKGEKLARLAGMLCQQTAFMQFSGSTSPDDAADFIRRTCGVKSRAELDHNLEAAALFHERVRKPFAYKKEK